MTRLQNNEDLTSQQPQSQHHHHHHHHHHRHSLSYRMRRWIKEHKNLLIAFAAAVALAAALLGFMVYRRQAQQRAQHVTAGNSYDMGVGYREITYEGKKYRYNTLITSVLYAGIDSDGEIEAFDTYGMAPRADSISLVIMDKKHEKMSILSLNRDIMTQIHRYDMYGADDGVYESHLGYAYSYGDGLEFSCENLREAVETLLQIPVDEYFVSNRGSMAFINDLVGGVTVTVPDDDLSADYPEMTKGSRVAITEKNINAFLRSRDTDVDFSNEGRIERQRVYINAYVEKLRGMLPDRTQEIWKELEEKSRYLLTSITKNKYLQFAGLLSTVQYGEDDFYKAPGEDRQGEYHDEFVVDQEALRSLVVNLFYEPA